MKVIEPVSASQSTIQCDSCDRWYFSKYEALMCAIDDAHTNLQGYRDVPRLARLQTLREKLDKLEYFLNRGVEGASLKKV